MSASTQNSNLCTARQTTAVRPDETLDTNVNKKDQEHENEQQTREKNKRETQEISSERPFIINSLIYILIVIFVGLPMWFYTCSVTRYSIPDLHDLEQKLIHSSNAPPKLHLDISIVQLTNDHNLPAYLRPNLPSVLETSHANISYRIDWRVRRPTDQEINLFQSHLREHFANDNITLSEKLQTLENNLLQLHKPSNRFRQFIYLIDETNYAAFCDSSRAHTYTISFERFVYLCPSTALAPADNHQIVLNLIISALEEIYSNTVDPSRLKNSVNSKMDLIISLLPEGDQVSFKKLTEFDDLIHHIYDKNVKTRFPELKELIDITAISQFIFEIIDGDLLKKILIKPKVMNQTTGDNYVPRVLDSGKIDQLFQRFESEVSQRSTPNIHNVLFVIPDPKKPNIVFDKDSSNLRILEGRESSTLLILSDDKSLVLGLRALVRRVVGLASPNLCENCIVRRDVFFNRWEMDAITGALTIAKLDIVLRSLRSISLQVVGIKIPKDVSAMVGDAYDIALEALSKLERKETLEAYRLASKSYDLSESAYFNPSLIESLYFPDEFKYAIYLPLAPMIPPILMSILRLFKALVKSLRSSNTNDKLKIN